MGSDKEGSSSDGDSEYSIDRSTRHSTSSGSEDDDDNTGHKPKANPGRESRLQPSSSSSSRWGSSEDPESTGTHPVGSNHSADRTGQHTNGRKRASKRQSSMSDDDILAGLAEFSGARQAEDASKPDSRNDVAIAGHRSSGSTLGDAGTPQQGRRHQIRTSLSQVSVWDPKSPQTPSSLRVKGVQEEGGAVSVGMGGDGGKGVGSGGKGAKVPAGALAALSLRVRWPDQVPVMELHAADSPLAGCTTQVGACCGVVSQWSELPACRPATNQCMRERYVFESAGWWLLNSE